MAEEKKTFIGYCNWLQYVEDLEENEAGKIFIWLLKYVNSTSENNPPYPTEKHLKVICKLFQTQLYEDFLKWKDERERRSEAGKKGMAIRWNNKDNNVITNNNKNNTDINEITNITDNVYVDVDDNVNDNDNVNVIYGNKLPVYNTHEEETHIKNLQQLIELVEMNIYNKPISNADTKILKNICNEFSFDSVYRDLENYKRDGIKQPIPYYKKALENAEIQEKVFKKMDDDEIKNNNTPKTYEFNDYMSAFKVYVDEDAPQHIRDKAKEFMDGKRGN